ncbi:uncharacterized protein LOC129753235 [Uranotaenia lowii]|uniref:uncharacterized protein LOC129753235 n=1 Tax=Uranotaenia lowii TaxID=190385 RepID=UPI002479A323|nr:uncharacterized protein LOC129753235 [Uranotaenia lowii]
MIHPATGKSPSMLVFGRQIRSRLDLMIPSDDPKGNEIQRKIRELQVNSRVSAREYVNANKWEFGRIMQRLGKLHYLVELDDGRQWKRHIDQLRSVGSGVQSSSTNEFFDRGENVDDNVAITTHASKNDLSDIPDLDNNVAHPGQFSSSAAEPVTDPGEHTESKRLVFPAGASAGEGLRRSVRTIKPPQRLDL